MTTDDEYDVVVVGAGPAGLTGALVLVRARRSVLVVDDGTPRNAASTAVHGYLTRDGMPPAEFLAAGRAEVERYGGHVITDQALTASGEADAFTITLRGRAPVTARRLLVTTGLTDVLPDVPGLTERWGRDVVHCTACHGWEARDQTIAILATSAAATDHAITWGHWTNSVLLLRHTAEALDPTLAMVLAADGITEVPGEVQELIIDDDRLTGVELRDRTLVQCDALAVQPVAVARSSLLESLGLPLAQNAYGTRIAADRLGLTAKPGVWVAGNVTDLGAQVVTAAAAGYTAGAAINNELIINAVTARLTQALAPSP
jgi:thioredoxin reductase